MGRTKKKLSIIIPCYNCFKTLRDAVDSCYEQGFSESEFEIVMVDDGSTDSTWQMMQNIAAKRSNVTLLQHNKNRGGGAARNTGIEIARAENIITFDSDDVLGKNVLKLMSEQLSVNRENIDGVVFGYKMSFQEQLDKAKKNELYRPEGKKSFTFADIFSGDDWGVGLNFMFTKSAWSKIGGYPTHHPLDTQGFGVRFLAEGFQTQTCYEAFFYHRQFTGEPSYFERAYADGYLSIGYFLSYFEYLYKFQPATQDKIITHNIFQNNNLSTDSIQRMLVNEYNSNSNDFFSKNIKPESTTYKLCTAWKNRDMSATLQHLAALKEKYPIARSIDFMAIFILARIADPDTNTSKVIEVVQSLSPEKKKEKGLRASHLKKVLVSIKKYVTHL